MTSPYSSSLLNSPSTDESGGTATVAVPRPGSRGAAPAPQRVAPVPQQYVTPPMVQQPIYVQQAPSGGSNLTMALMVILLAVLAGGAGYLVATATAPSADESTRYQALAAQNSYLSGTQIGQQVGRQWALTTRGPATALRAQQARQAAYNKGVRAGRKAGLAYSPRTYSGYSGGYSNSRPSYSGIGQVGNAVAMAQSIADSTGAPVDVEVYD